MSDDLRKRDPRNAPGPFYAVERLCLACGLPEDEAPDLLADLEATGGDTYFVRQPTTPEEVERACAALDVCCVRALRYAGDDPAIIRRLGSALTPLQCPPPPERYPARPVRLIGSYPSQGAIFR